ncbi:MAG: peptide-methionine (R)-S-oxide reductase [Nibricoccus sp.]
MSNATPTTQVTRTDAEWKKLLTAEQYHVLRQKGTERAFTGEYTDKTDPGTYLCAACGAELFASQTKFHSGCGWPSFYTSLAGDRVKLTPDNSYGMTRAPKSPAPAAARTWGTSSTTPPTNRPASGTASTPCR